MTTPEAQREEELAALARERNAFDRRQKACFAVQRQFLPSGNGMPSTDSMDELDAAEQEWRAATAEIDRITQEILSGKRR